MIVSIQWTTIQQLKNNELLLHVITWMHLSIIMLSERDQGKRVHIA